MKREEKEEFLDAETVEDKEIDYSKYEERKSSVGQNEERQKIRINTIRTRYRRECLLR